MDTNESDQTLERQVRETLAELPMRRAPATLEARVLSELARRAALPWWRRSFAHWPLAARAGFLAVCAVSIAFALRGAAAAMDAVHSLAWAREAGMLMASGGNLLAALAHAPVPGWLYGAMTVYALLYAFLFGLGAAVYRMLYLTPAPRQVYHP